MRALSATELLSIWEQGAALSVSGRARLLLTATAAPHDQEHAARLSIGQRDARLITLREQLFGRLITGLAVCPGCGENVELQFDLCDIQQPQPENSTEEHELSVDGWRMVVRPVNSLDLDGLHPNASVDENRRHLLACCVRSICHDGAEVSVGQLPDAMIAKVAHHLGEIDPQADVRIALLCPVCGHRWQAPFDIVSFLWAELHAWAVRLLREVHALASTYGWREPDILALSPSRRRAYLEMVET